MEGNECYKFSTIRDYIDRTGDKDIRVIADVGANVGSIALMMRSYFPRSKIYAFEAIEDSFQAAQANTQRAEDIKLFKRGVTTAHLFFDDLGKRPRPSPVSLVSLKGLPEAGPGWRGGSLVLPADHEMLAATTIRGYERTS